MKRLIYTILTLLLFINTTNNTHSQELTPKEIFNKCEGAVVVVQALDNNSKQLGLGSGVVINEKGWIVTNYHVYKNDDYKAAKLSIKHKDIQIEYTDIIGFDILRDLLILKINNKNYDFPSIKIGNSDKLEVGDPLYSIGSPQGLENSLYPGLVSGINREIPWSKYPAIQMSCIIDHGSSGGAVINAFGELIGISTWGIGNIFFAIPANDIFKLYISSYGDAEGEKYINYFDLGYKAAQDNKYVESIYFFSLYIDKYPNNAYAYLNRGITKCYLQKYDESIIDFTKAIQLQADFADAYNNRGVAFRNLDRYYEAIDDYDKVIQLKPDNAMTYVNRGAVYYFLKKYDKVILDNTKAIQLKPEYAEAYRNRGLGYYAKNDCDNAMKDFKKAIIMDPSYESFLKPYISNCK